MVSIIDLNEKMRIAATAAAIAVCTSASANIIPKMSFALLPRHLRSAISRARIAADDSTIKR